MISRHLKHVLRLLAGVASLVIGVLGLFLPLLPGLVFIFLGLTLLAPSHAARIQMRLMSRFSKDGIFRIHRWEKEGVRAGFTTRRFPVFMQKTDALKDPAVQAEFSKYFPGKIAVLNQIHSDGITVLNDPEEFPKDGFYHFPGSDAVITNVRGLTLLVFTADCLPVFLCAGDWIGLVHAGWKGTQMRILPKTVALLSEKSGIPVSHVQALFGPCIRRKSYEVGPEFLKIFPRTTKPEKDGLRFDLAAENRHQLESLGADPERLSDVHLDTFAEAGELYSFRREKESAGRLVSFMVKSDFS